MLVFGPVPSRRLGRSLGINNIPHKTCSYSCIYCQLGKTTTKTIERKIYYNPEDIRREVEQKVEEFKDIDYLTFVPSGEPTLDANLGKEIEFLKDFSIKIAVLTNASLLWKKEVRDDLSKADWVSIKIDSAIKEKWLKINRPFPSLDFETILKGIIDFSSNFSGFLSTETMLIHGVNDTEFDSLIDLMDKINPKKSYISTPTRPPAEKWVEPAREESINQLYQEMKERGINPELLIHYEGKEFGISKDIKESILSIASVHPIREDYLFDLLARAGAGAEVINELIKKGELVELNYRGLKFYVKRTR